MIVLTLRKIGKFVCFDHTCGNPSSFFYPREMWAERHFLHTLTSDLKRKKINPKPLIWKVRLPRRFLTLLQHKKWLLRDFLPQNPQHQVQTSKCLLQAAWADLPVLCSINMSFLVGLFLFISNKCPPSFLVFFFSSTCLIVRTKCIVELMNVLCCYYLLACTCTDLLFLCFLFFLVCLFFFSLGEDEGQNSAEALVLKIQKDLIIIVLHITYVTVDCNSLLELIINSNVLF